MADPVVTASTVPAEIVAPLVNAKVDVSPVDVAQPVSAEVAASIPQEPIETTDPAVIIDGAAEPA